MIAKFFTKSIFISAIFFLSFNTKAGFEDIFLNLESMLESVTGSLNGVSGNIEKLTYGMYNVSEEVINKTTPEELAKMTAIVTAVGVTVVGIGNAFIFNPLAKVVWYGYTSCRCCRKFRKEPYRVKPENVATELKEITRL